jgi:hypothetical protein
MNTCGNSRQCLSAGLPTFQRSTTGHSRLNVSRQSAQMGSPSRSQARTNLNVQTTLTPEQVRDVR